MQGIINTVKRVKSRLSDANYARDPAHFMIPETLRQTEDEIPLVCSRKQMSIYDMQPPPQISVIKFLFGERSTAKLGYLCKKKFHELPAEEQNRRLSGQVPKEILTIFFYWDGDRVLMLLRRRKESLSI